MRKLSATVFIFALIATLSADAALAQQPDSLAQQPPTIFMTAWMCDRAAVDTLVATAGERAMPVAQELVNEGMLWSYSVMVHNWGDEWNYVTLMLADDIASGVAANAEFGRRIEAKYGEDETFVEQCRAHNDGIYTGSYITDDAPGVDPEPPYTIAFSYFACPFNVLDDVVQEDRERFLPAAQASVTAGKGYFTAAMTHAWAGEWTYVIVRGAQDIPSLIDFAADTGTRMGDDAGQAAEACTAHKDNIYRVVLETQPRSE